MLSTRSVFEEIRANDAAYRIFLSVAAQGEAQGGWENERLAALTPDAELRAKIARHAEDETKHGRLFLALLRKRGLEREPVPPGADYTMLLERAGMGVAHQRLRQDTPVGEREIIEYLAHGRVTEQRGAEELETQRRVFHDDPEIGKAIRMIADDEVNHLAHCHEELLRVSRAGHEPTVRELLRRYALTEIRVYRDVCLTMNGLLAERLGWGRFKRGLFTFGIHGRYGFERAWGWRRLITLREPERRNALGGKRPAHVPAPPR